ncbi:MAG: imelysin family protein [Octadecabacter sp.]|nr:imelysin family protein [Octadecabacter sp.]
MKLAIAFILAPVFVAADSRVREVLDDHILPRFAALSVATSALADAQNCDIMDKWNTAAAAWIAVSHLRFGPSEAENRAFALAFWPDPRGSTPKSLVDLLADDDPVIVDASVAGRGFYAMEFLLFDLAFSEANGRCDLVAALARDAHTTVQEIEKDWQNRYAELMRNTGNDTYRNDTEALQELYKSLTSGLDFTASMRLGRPLGTFDRPRPLRAEMRRSAQSLNNIAVSLRSLEELAFILSADEPDAAIGIKFNEAMSAWNSVELLEGSDDLSVVTVHTSRLKVETLQQRIFDIRVFLSENLGPELGVIEGFNSLDGD